MRIPISIASLTSALVTALSFSLTLSFAASAEPVKLREDAPDRYVVVKGDTLWDISAKFLHSPWLWPELWQLNKDQVRNPHRIYPGDVLFLTMTAAGPRLSRMETVKLSPSVHAEQIPREANITTIPYASIKGFLQRPLVSGGASLDNAPTLLGSADGRLMVTTGDHVYANGVPAGIQKWSIVRFGKSLRDPDTEAELAREVEYVGDASVLAAGAPATLTVNYAEREVLTGDRLVPAPPEGGLDFVPRAPGSSIKGRIISAYGGTQASGKNFTVVLNLGKADGLEVGHVLSVFREGRVVGKAPFMDRIDSFDPKSGYLNAAKEREAQIEYKDLGEEALALLDPFEFFFKPYPDGRRGWRYLDYKCLKPDARVAADILHDPATETQDCASGEKSSGINWAYMDIGCLKPGKQISFGDFFDPKEVYEPHCRPQNVKLPDVRTGMVMVYRVFDRVAYALVMESFGPIYLLDTVKNP